MAVDVPFYTFEEEMIPFEDNSPNTNIQLIFGDESSFEKFLYKREVDPEKLMHPIMSFEKALYGENAFAGAIFGTAKDVLTQTITYAMNKRVNLSSNYVSKRDLALLQVVSGNVKNIAQNLASNIANYGIAGVAVSAVDVISGGAISTYQAYDAQDVVVQNKNLQTAFYQARFKGSLNDWSRGTDN